MDGMSQSKVCRCAIYSLTVNSNSVLYVLCRKWMYVGCAKVKSVIAKFS